jgi:hypothetical protein
MYSLDIAAMAITVECVSETSILRDGRTQQQNFTFKINTIRSHKEKRIFLKIRILE